MPEYQASVQEFIVASKKVMALGNLSNEEVEAIRIPLEQLLGMIGRSDEE